MKSEQSEQVITVLCFSFFVFFSVFSVTLWLALPTWWKSRCCFDEKASRRDGIGRHLLRSSESAGSLDNRCPESDKRATGFPQ
jgi:hypothetical protein